jgi:hypothetical protein
MLCLWQTTPACCLAHPRIYDKLHTWYQGYLSFTEGAMSTSMHTTVDVVAQSLKLLLSKMKKVALVLLTLSPVPTIIVRVDVAARTRLFPSVMKTITFSRTSPQSNRLIYKNQCNEYCIIVCAIYCV